MREQIVQLLIAERDRLQLAIDALQGPTTRRGRPSKNAVALNGIAEPKKRKKRTFTDAQRKAFGLRMKAYWAAKKKAGKG